MNTLPAAKHISASLANGHADAQSVMSGFGTYDKVTHGFLKGTLTVIASRPSMGKSAFADTVALKLAVEEKKSALYYSIREQN